MTVNKNGRHALQSGAFKAKTREGYFQAVPQYGLSILLQARLVKASSENVDFDT